MMIKKSNVRFIDLGLPSKTLWGDRNLGNNRYYQWGSLTGYKENQILFNWDSYSKSNYSKYNSRIEEVLQAEDDIVTQIFGENYRTPRLEDFDELLKYTEQIYNINSMIFKSKINKNLIHFYFFGYASNERVIHKSNFIGIWSSSYGSFHNAGYLEFSKARNVFLISKCNFCFGLNIRPIKYDKEN